MKGNFILPAVYDTDNRALRLKTINPSTILGVWIRIWDCFIFKTLKIGNFFTTYNQELKKVRQGIEDFYIEVGVEKSNIASQKVASSVLKAIPVDSIDPDSGTPTFGYMCKASTLNFSERYV